AGQQVSVTITGTGFGNAPTLSAVGTGVTLTLNSANPSGTSIQATATVALSAPSETVSIVVQPGYSGSSFICVCNGRSPNGTSSATVIPVTPKPQIMFNGQNISGTTQAVVAGQQIPLSVPTPTGYTIQSQSWFFAHQSAITGGFVNGAGTSGSRPSASSGGAEAPDPPLTQNSITFYWVDPGDNGETVTYTYTLNNGQSASATATFNVGGPTGNLLLTGTMQPNNQGVGIGVFGGLSKLSTVNTPVPGGTVGISFTANAATPQNDAGSFQWVQLINGDQTDLISSTGANACPVNPDSGLDTTYPYAAVTATTTYDTPASNLVSIYGELERSFTATMYLLWDPALPAGCAPASTTAQGTSTVSNCTSTPIPLSSVQWHWSGCGINKLVNQANGTTWNLQCGINNVSASQAAGYPEWNNTTTAGVHNCGPMN
ncbi:MAG: hypothetical protein ACRD3S_08260, partial [Terracidiphilus sp.]